MNYTIQTIYTVYKTKGMVAVSHHSTLELAQRRAAKFTKTPVKIMKVTLPTV